MSNAKKRLIFIVVYLAYTSIYIARINLSMAGPGLIGLKVLNEVQLGALGSVFSAVYACGRLVNGHLSDRNPPYLMLTVGLAFVTVSNICFSFFPPFWALLIFWAANAFAQSMLWSSVLCVISGLYDPETAKRKNALMVTSVAAGNVLAILINTFFITRFGTKYAFIIPGLLTLILGFAVFLLTKKVRPVQVSRKASAPFALLKDRKLVIMCFPAVLHGVMKENITLWMTVFIIDLYAVDLAKSSWYILLIPVIGLIGRLLYLPFYRLFKENENRVSLFGFLLCVLGAVVLSMGKTAVLISVVALSVIYAAVSLINTSLLSIFPTAYLKKGAMASVSGLMDFSTYLGGGLSGIVYGWIISKFGYTPMFFSWLIISLISIAILYAFQKMTARKNKKSNSEVLL